MIPRNIPLYQSISTSILKMSASSSSAPPSTTSSSYSRPKKPLLTHFLCIPLHNATQQLATTLNILHTDLDINDLASPSAARPAITLHLTLGVMSLPSTTDVQRAVEFLQNGVDYTSLLQDGGPLTIDLRGVDAMGDRRRASVLYAVPVDATGRLRAFAEGVRGAFVGAGLVLDEGRELKLHATVLNTVYSTRERGRDGRKRRETFDAVGMVDKYKDYEFAGGVLLDKVAVCRMGEVKGAGGKSEGYLVCGEKAI